MQINVMLRKENSSDFKVKNKNVRISAKSCSPGEFHAKRKDNIISAFYNFVNHIEIHFNML